MKNLWFKNEKKAKSYIINNNDCGNGLVIYIGKKAEPYVIVHRDTGEVMPLEGNIKEFYKKVRNIPIFPSAPLYFSNKKSLTNSDNNSNKKPFIIEFEGTDRSGKETQTKLLENYINSLGLKCKRVSFPNYDSESSYWVKEYLNGRFGSNPNALNEYQASMLYALDRMISVKNDDWDQYDVIILDRYVGSNLIHQTAKLNSLYSKANFINYWYDFEFNKLNLPKPDLCFFLDMPIELGKKISKDRSNKITKSSKQDIHESNDEYMINAYSAAKLVANRYACSLDYKWITIKCFKGKKFKKVRTRNSIQKEIQKYLRPLLNKIKE